MHSFQVRLADRVFTLLKAAAQERETAVAEIVRQSIEVYIAGLTLARDGKLLVWEDPITGDRAQVLIPGLTMIRPSAHREQLSRPREPT